MRHKGCGGEIYENDELRVCVPTEDDHGVTVAKFYPTLWCRQCNTRILGDNEIELSAELEEQYQ